MFNKEKIELLEMGCCPYCAIDMEKSCYIGGHSDDKTGTCPKCGYRDKE